VRSGRYAVLDVCDLILVQQARDVHFRRSGDARPLLTLTGFLLQTFNVACYGPDYQPHQDVVDFFDAVVRAFKQFPTYDILAS